MHLIKSSKIKFFAAIGFLLFIFSLSFSAAFAQVPITTDSRIRTLVYNPNEVYELKFYYNYQSFIEFSEDEEIEMISIGEAFAWRLTPAGKRLFIRPLEVSAHTNMTIITSKRTYHFDIRSAEFSGKADEDLVYTIRFFYPQIGQPLPIPPQLTMPNPAMRPMPVEIPVSPAEVASEKAAEKAKAEQVRTPFPGARVDDPFPDVIDRNPEGTPLNFDYKVAGKSDDIAPLKVYDNSEETFFQFPNNNQVIPSISLVDQSGAEQILKYTIRDDYVVIPTTGVQFTLRLADSLLCIYNNNLVGQK